MAADSRNSFGSRGTLSSGGRTLQIYRLAGLGGGLDASRLPFSLKILLENLLRHEDDVTVKAADIEALILHVKRTVAAELKVELTTEVRIVGDPV